MQSQGFSKDKLSLIKPNDELFLSKQTWLQLPRALHLCYMNFQYKENGETLFYEIEANGQCIQLMGSADLDENIVYPINADALILPHQGRSDIDKYNQRIINILKPKRILLDHYDNTFPPISSNVEVDEFCDQMSKTITTEKLIKRKTITIT